MLFESHVCCKNSGMTVRQTQCSSVCCTNTDSSCDSCFWSCSIQFYSIPFHSTPFHFVTFHSSQLLRFCELLFCYIFTLVVLFFDSLTVTFAGTEEAVLDLVVSCSRLQSCFNLWPGTAADNFVDKSSSVLRLVKLNSIILCFSQTYILQLPAQSQPTYFHFI